MPKVLLVAALVLAAPALAQPAALTFSARADVGYASFGHFLEQRTGPGAERELQAEPAVQFGGAVGVALDRTTVEVGVRFAPTTLRFRDDSGTGSSALDEDDLADLSLTTVSASLRTSAETFRLGPFRPYALAGLSLGVWSVETDGTPIAATDDTQVRFGGETGTGLTVGEGRVSGFAEVAITALQNPFDGSDAFRYTGGGTTFDEPSVATVRTVRGGLTVRF